MKTTKMGKRNKIAQRQKMNKIAGLALVCYLGFTAPDSRVEILSVPLALEAIDRVRGFKRVEFASEETQKMLDVSRDTSKGVDGVLFFRQDDLVEITTSSGQVDILYIAGTSQSFGAIPISVFHQK